MNALPAHLMAVIFQPIIADMLLVSGGCKLNKAKLIMMLFHVKGEYMGERLKDAVEVAHADNKLKRSLFRPPRIDIGLVDRWKYKMLESGVLEIKIDIEICFLETYKEIAKNIVSICVYAHENYPELTSVNFVPTQKKSENRGDGLFRTMRYHDMTWSQAIEINPCMQELRPITDQIARWIQVTRQSNVTLLRAKYCIEKD